MSFLTAYVVVAGTFTASLQVGRGVVRGAGKLIQGDTRGALAEVAAGAMAPVMSAYHQICELGEDVCRAAGALVTEDDEQVTAPLARLYLVPHDRTPGSGASAAGAPLLGAARPDPRVRWGKRMLPGSALAVRTQMSVRTMTSR
jgi:hypothetical protein